MKLTFVFVPLEMNYRPVKYETLKLNPIIYTDV